MLLLRCGRPKNCGPEKDRCIVECVEELDLLKEIKASALKLAHHGCDEPAGCPWA